MSSVVASAKRLVPIGVKDAVKRILGRMPERVDVTGVATTVDLYVWLVGAGMDTIVPLQNWYSVFFPTHRTDTVATFVVYADDGREITRSKIDVPSMATPTVSIAELLRAAGVVVDDDLRCGSVAWHLEAPADVHEHVLAGGDRFVFWDRSYIGYTGAGDHVAWVHGVDKHHVVQTDGGIVPWPLTPGAFTSSPEIPVDLHGCETFEVIVQNRDVVPRRPTLVVADHSGASIELQSSVAPMGVHRFVVSGACEALDLSAPLRLQVDDLPTRYGRPIVLRRFRGGSFSLMHC